MVRIGLILGVLLLGAGCGDSGGSHRAPATRSGSGTGGADSREGARTYAPKAIPTH